MSIKISAGGTALRLVTAGFRCGRRARVAMQGATAQATRVTAPALPLVAILDGSVAITGAVTAACRAANLLADEARRQVAGEDIHNRGERAQKAFRIEGDALTVIHVGLAEHPRVEHERVGRRWRSRRRRGGRDAR